MGRFAVRKRLGAGAFAAVYEAYDPQLDRTVALKVPHPGCLDGPRRVERFLREAKAAANLRHPNIVPLYESGQDGDRYYIASAFIQGTTLADALGDGQPLKPAAAAKIVRALAEALAYAHEQGIVHRDVKPANVMLDGKRQPFLMDFGLASRKESASKITNEGAVLGTPSYMAPEQASGKSGEAGPPADQYSLGCVLFELMTGVTPFDGTPEAQVYQHVRTEAPSPRKVNPKVPIDLAAVCLKCLEKDPARRYTDCDELAEDLRRFLAGEPTAARPLGPLARAERWRRRNPAIFGLTVGLALVLVSGLITSTLLWWRASRGETEAREQAELAAANAQKAEENALAEKQAKMVAQTREREASEQRDKARGNLRLANVNLGLARSAVDDMYTRVAEEWLAEQPQLEPIQREFLEKALKFYARFAREGGADPAIRFETATAHRRVADIEYKLADKKAEDSFVQAIDSFQKLADEFPDVPAYRQSLAGALRTLAELLSTTGRMFAAEMNLRRSLALQEKLVADFPTNADYRIDLGQVYYLAGNGLFALGRFREAEKYLRSALAIHKALVAEFPSVAKYQLHLARSSFALSNALHPVRFGTGQGNESKQAAQEASDILAKLVAQHESVPVYRAELATVYNRMSQTSATLAEADPLAQKALALRERLSTDFPSVAKYRFDLVNSYQRLGELARGPGRTEDAENAFRRASALIDKLAADAPTVIHFHSKRAEISGCLGAVQMKAGRLSEAEETFRQSCIIRQKVLADFPEAAASKHEKLTLVWSMYHVASCQALLVPKSADPGRQADLAMDTLTKAVRAGYSDPGFMAKDKNLNALRNREDFKKLLADLEKSKGVKPK